MDDAKIADEMTLDGIAKRLEALQTTVAGLQSNMTEMKSEMTEMKSGMAGMTTEISDVKHHVKTGFNESRIRDEELRDLMKFGLEAREALRETVDARFDATDKKHDEELGLLKSVLRAVTHP
jgi:uncharacterized coiled-coil DUF342 family protein